MCIEESNWDRKPYEYLLFHAEHRLYLSNPRSKQFFIDKLYVSKLYVHVSPNCFYYFCETSGKIEQILSFQQSYRIGESIGILGDYHRQLQWFDFSFYDLSAKRWFLIKPAEIDSKLSHKNIDLSILDLYDHKPFSDTEFLAELSMEESYLENPFDELHHNSEHYSHSCYGF